MNDKEVLTSDLFKKLFNWKSHVVINGVDFYVRIVGDQVVDEARKKALLSSRRLRRDLRDENSDAYLMYLDIVSEMETQDVIDSIIVMEARDYMREYIQQTPRPPLPDLPEYPTQEQQEEYEAAKEEREDDYIEQMKINVDAWREDLEKVLKKMKRESLESRWKKGVTDKVCSDEFTAIFEDYLVASGTYLDEGFNVRAFTYEQYRSLPSDVKQSLRDTYDNISMDTEDLKK